MARIWIVEDDPSIGMLIEMTVKKDGHETVRMPDGETLDRQLGVSPLPDLLLLDLMLRKKSGYVILKEWKERAATEKIPVIILSARSAESDKVRGLELGAEDYMTKPFGVRELQARVKTALRRVPKAPQSIRLGAVEIRPQTRDVYVDGQHAQLTGKEYDVLLALARSAGATVTRGALLRGIWGYETDEDPTRLVDTHIKTLRAKLGGASDMIRTVRGAGYRLIAGDGE